MPESEVFAEGPSQRAITMLISAATGVDAIDHVLASPTGGKVEFQVIVDDDASVSDVTHALERGLLPFRRRQATFDYAIVKKRDLEIFPDLLYVEVLRRSA
jgi:hypothetical protein